MEDLKMNLGKSVSFLSLLAGGAFAVYQNWLAD